ncbi:MAG: ArnT family glycosyltransferase [Thermoleophilaceae bacterium]
MESSAATVRAPAALRLPRVRPELLALIGLAALLNLWALGQNGWANEYYSAAVKSMSSSWHAFLYDSFDKSGVMTVDKPPLALWVQVASVKLFGFSSLSMLIPQALTGAASVGLVYDLTRRVFGRPAGFVAGLALATTPVMVAVSRHNNPDALLVLCSVAALWAMVRAFEDGRTRWLVVAGICIGLGFETKMAVALMVVPALAAAWLWVAPRGRTAALRQLLAGGAAMLVVGAAWPLLMLLTPAADRPWVSGTADNSVLSLIFGYNGFSRIAGQAGGPGSFGANTMFGGPNGPLRLVEASLGGQAGWLLGFAIAGGLGLVVATRLRRGDARTGWLVATGGSFLTIAVAFSAAKGIFHPYYVSLLAPFAAALVGATTGHLLEGGRAARLLAPLAVLGGVATELAVLNDYPGDLTWLRPLLVVLGLAAAGALAVTGLERHRKTVLAAAVALLLVAPAIWSAQTLGHPANGTFPSGGSSSTGLLAGGPGGPGGPGGGPPGGMQAGGPPGLGGRSQQLASVLRYTRAHGGGTVAVSSQQDASAQIIGSGSDVAALGGFSGRESEVSVNWFADAVRAGKIRWVLTDGAGSFGPDNRVGSSKLMAAVQRTCKQVSTGLYDCGSYADALAAEAS